MRVDIHIQGKWSVRRGAVRAVFSHIAKKMPAYRHASVSVAFLGSAAVRTMNRTYRGKDRATNVLSFADGARKLPHVDREYLGEIIIAYPVARAEARRDRVSIQHRLSVLLTHGFLHLVGYDHQTDFAERRMQTAEEHITGEWLRS